MADHSVSDSYKYIPELVWIPTYICVAALVMGASGGGPIGSVFVLFAVVACRVILELICRFVFGAERLKGTVWLSAFVLQLIVWTGVWFALR